MTGGRGDVPKILARTDNITNSKHASPARRILLSQSFPSDRLKTCLMLPQQSASCADKRAPPLLADITAGFCGKEWDVEACGRLGCLGRERTYMCTGSCTYNPTSTVHAGVVSATSTWPVPHPPSVGKTLEMHTCTVFIRCRYLLVKILGFLGFT